MNLQVDLHGVPAIGDSLRDIHAAQAVGARPILVRTGKGEAAVLLNEGLNGVEIHADLAAAAEVLSRDSGEINIIPRA